VVLVAAGSGYGGKPRPAVVIQSDAFPENDSLTLCLFTSFVADATSARPRVNPSHRNGLNSVSWLMTDKIVTIQRDKIGPHIGRLNVAEMKRLDDAIALFLGLTE
jgi:mRNA interferase MazF